MPRILGLKISNSIFLLNYLPNVFQRTGLVERMFTRLAKWLIAMSLLPYCLLEISRILFGAMIVEVLHVILYITCRRTPEDLIKCYASNAKSHILHANAPIP